MPIEDDDPRIQKWILETYSDYTQTKLQEKRYFNSCPKASEATGCTKSMLVNPCKSEHFLYRNPDYDEKLRHKWIRYKTHVKWMAKKPSVWEYKKEINERRIQQEVERRLQERISELNSSSNESDSSTDLSSESDSSESPRL